MAFKASVLASSLALAAVVAGCNQNNTGGGSGSGILGGNRNNGAVVTVNGEAVGRDALHEHLEANYGESAVRQLIDFALVTQKLKAEKLSVSEEEVNAAIEARKGSSPDMAQIIEGKGVRLAALQRQTRYQLAIDKLLTKDVKVTEDQIKKWFETRRKFYDTPAKAKLGILLSTSKAKADTMAAQLKAKSKTFEQLVASQKTANDPAAGSSIAETPEMIPIDVLPDALKKAVNGLQTGQSSNVVSFKVGPNPAPTYAILRLVQKQPAVKADAAKLKGQLEMDYKLEQVARKLNGDNPSNPPFDQTLVQVQNAIRSQGGSQTPGFREILAFITQTQSTNLTSGLRTAAKVETTDPTYTKIAESFKPMPGMTAPPSGPGGAPAPSGAAPSGAAPSSPAPASPAPAAPAPAAPAPAAPAPAAPAPATKAPAKQ